MHRQWFCENHYGTRKSKTLSLHICEWLTWQSQICDNKQIKCHVRPCPTEIKRFRWKTVRQSATLNCAVLQGRQYASKHCKSSRKQSRNDRERLWERTTNSRICLQTSDNVRVQRSNISALRSTWNMSTNCGGIHVTQHEPVHNFTCQHGWSTHSVKSNRQASDKLHRDVSGYAER